MSVVRELLVKLGFSADVSGAKAFEAQTQATTAAVQAQGAVVSKTATATATGTAATAAGAVAKGKDAAATKGVTQATVAQTTATVQATEATKESAAATLLSAESLLKMGAAAAAAGLALKTINDVVLANMAKALTAFNEAAKANIYAENFQRIDAVAQRTGVQVGTLVDGLKTLRWTMLQAGMGNSYASAGFAALNVRLTDTKGKVRSVTDVFADAATGLAKMEPGWRKARIAALVFGGAADSLMPVLNRGGDAFRSYMRDAESMGLVLSKVQVDAGVRAADGIARLEMRAQGLKNAFGAALIPAVEETLGKLNKFGDAHGAQALADMRIIAEGLGKAIYGAGIAVEFLYNHWEQLSNAVVATSPVLLLMKALMERDVAEIATAPVDSTYRGDSGKALPPKYRAQFDKITFPHPTASQALTPAGTAAYAGSLKAMQTTNNHATTINVGGISVTVEAKNAEDARALGNRLSAQVALTLQDKLAMRMQNYAPAATQRQE